MTRTRILYRAVAASILSLVLAVAAVGWGNEARARANETYSGEEILRLGHDFFGGVSGGLASIVERVVERYGLPNGYIIGEEAGGALIGGVRYGEGMLHVRGEPPRRVFWQGPSVGFDFGGEGARTMMLVYDLPGADAIYRRFAGVDGSAYLVGGFGMTVLAHRRGGRNISLVPIRSGVGARLGLSASYLKFTGRPTWNPF